MKRIIIQLPTASTGQVRAATGKQARKTKY